MEGFSKKSLPKGYSDAAIFRAALSFRDINERKNYERFGKYSGFRRSGSQITI